MTHLEDRQILVRYKPSYSRPRVSDDNAFAEALFRTAKYRPEFPITGLRRRRPARSNLCSGRHRRPHAATLEGR
jgi:transposase InsO family protein